MKYLIICMVVPFITTCKPKPAYNPTSDEPQVMVEMASPALPSSNKLDTRYTLTKGSCQISWQALSEKKDGRLDVQLRNRSQCEQPFQEVTPFHGQVLDRLLKDYPPNLIKDIVTGGLRSLQADGSWNAAVAKAARGSADYQAYRRQYPNHASKKSVNQIFVELLVQTQPHAPFKEMLNSYGLQFEVDQVEKVFNSSDQVQDRTIHDAGSMWWKPI